MSSDIFPIRAVIALYTGRMCVPIQLVYELLEHITGEAPFTHQIPRFLKEVQPFLKEKFPQLEATIEEAKNIKDEKSVAEWGEIWGKRYGRELIVPKMPKETHKSINLFDDLPKSMNTIAVIK